jgi:hypothetical protein
LENVGTGGSRIGDLSLPPLGDVSLPPLGDVSLPPLGDVSLPPLVILPPLDGPLDNITAAGAVAHRTIHSLHLVPLFLHQITSTLDIFSTKRYYYSDYSLLY